MPDSKPMIEVARPSGSDLRAKRRQRLQTLRGTAEHQPLPNSSTERSGATRRAAMADGTWDDASPAQRRALSRIYRVLTETPADEAGLVPGTPFTQSGVARLLETLRSRSDADGAAGAKMASRVLKFLTLEGGVESFSVDRLQRIAQLAKNIGLRERGRS